MIFSLFFKKTTKQLFYVTFLLAIQSSLCMVSFGKDTFVGKVKHSIGNIQLRGSGFLIDSRSLNSAEIHACIGPIWAVTANHVIPSSKVGDVIKFQFPIRNLTIEEIGFQNIEAEVLQRNVVSDIALLKVKSSSEELLRSSQAQSVQCVGLRDQTENRPPISVNLVGYPYYSDNYSHLSGEFVGSEENLLMLGTKPSYKYNIYSEPGMSGGLATTTDAKSSIVGMILANDPSSHNVSLVGTVQVNTMIVPIGVLRAEIKGMLDGKVRKSKFSYLSETEEIVYEGVRFKNLTKRQYLKFHDIGGEFHEIVGSSISSTGNGFRPNVLSKFPQSRVYISGIDSGTPHYSSWQQFLDSSIFISILSVGNLKVQTLRQLMKIIEQRRDGDPFEFTVALYDINGGSNLIKFGDESSQKSSKILLIAGALLNASKSDVVIDKALLQQFSEINELSSRYFTLQSKVPFLERPQNQELSQIVLSLEERVQKVKKSLGRQSGFAKAIRELTTNIMFLKRFHRRYSRSTKGSLE